MLSVKLVPIVRRLSTRVGELAWDDGHAEEAAEQPLGFDVFAYQKAVASRAAPDVKESVEAAYMIGYRDGCQSKRLDANTPPSPPQDVPRETAHQKRVHSFHVIDAALAVLLITAVVAIATGPVDIMRPVVLLVMAVTAARLVVGVYGFR